MYMTSLWQLREHVLVTLFQTFLSININAVMVATIYINKSSLGFTIILKSVKGP